MKKLIATVLPLLLFTACLSEKEIAVMMDELSEKRIEALKAIDAQNWKLDSLLTIHDYFFNFSERVHLLKEEEGAPKNIQKYVKKNGAKIFCEGFLIPMAKWNILESFCSSGAFYKCSPEIQEYPNVRKKMMELLGSETIGALSKEKECN